MEEKHFIFVHGASHGAWCWYKLKPLIEAAGHRVTVLDMAACGINEKTVDEIHTLSEYSQPLLEKMATIPPNEKVILLGHSFGGFSLAHAMETYPDKISIAVFLTAYVPDTTHVPSYVLDKHLEELSAETLLDVQFLSNGSTSEPFTSSIMGPKFLSSSLYPLSPLEDLELAKTLVRPSPLFLRHLSKSLKFSNDKYGSIPKAYLVCSEDKVITKPYQEWMIENSGIQNVMEINGADHMAMFSKPHQLSQCLLEIALKYA